jgi:DNA invertase Pin-like site-specific DNA recombinase
MLTMMNTFEKVNKMKGKKIGYKRVSTILQNTDRQLDGLEMDKTFEDKVSGKDTNRPELKNMLEFIREGDEVFVHSMDRLARNLSDLKSLVDEITSKGAKVHFSKESLTFDNDSSNPMSNLLLNVIGAVSEFEREIIGERRQEGIRLAQKKGKFKGKQKVFSDENTNRIIGLIKQGIPKARIAREFNISRTSLYSYIKESKVIA